MKSLATKINIWSFIFMLLCWVAFFSGLSQVFDPHYMILVVSIVVFILSVVGLGGVIGWKTALLAIISIIGSIALVVLELWVIFIGRLLS